MALTNYLLQIMISDVTFSYYGFGLNISSSFAPFAALALFGVDQPEPAEGRCCMSLNWLPARG